MVQIRSNLLEVHSFAPLSPQNPAFCTMRTLFSNYSHGKQLAHTLILYHENFNYYQLHGIFQYSQKPHTMIFTFSASIMAISSCTVMRAFTFRHLRKCTCAMPLCYLCLHELYLHIKRSRNKPTPVPGPNHSYSRFVTAK